MENALRTIHPPKVMAMPVIFSIIYTLGMFGFLGLWLGLQYIPGFEGFEKYGLVFSLLCLSGAISNFAIMRGRRWGVIGQICVWVANLAINALFPREVGPYLGMAILLVVLWSVDVYRNRQSLY